MNQIRKRLTYGNVMSSIAVFLVLGGGAAFAASQLGKNTVGPKQLKKNAVRTAKIKGGAVTAAKLHKNAVKAAKIQNGAVVTNKLKNGAVTGDKVADGTLSGAKINASSTSFSQIVEKLRGNSSVPFTPGQVYPFNNATYTQPTGRDDQYLAAFDVKFAAGCVQPRVAAALLTKDAANPGSPAPPEIVGYGYVLDKGAGEVTRRVNFGPYTLPADPMFSIAPISPRNHSFSVLLSSAACSSGSGVSATGAELDVIGTTTG